MKGRTASGRTIEAREADNYHEWTFVIDGEPAEVTRANLYRDGGTRRYETTRGEVVFPHRLMSDDRTPRLDGELVEVEA